MIEGNCDVIGDSNIQSYGISDLIAIDDTSSLFLMVNEEFQADSFLSSVEFIARAPGQFRLGVSWSFIIVV